MTSLLAISLLKGFQCHCSQSFCPEISFRYEQNKWIIRLLYNDNSKNPNELVVLKFLGQYIDKKFLQKDIIFAMDFDEPINLIAIYEYQNEEDIQKIIKKDNIKFQEYLQNNKHQTVVEIRDQLLVSEDQKFYISQSTIPNAGYGLFSLVEFHRGDFLMNFKGTKILFHDFCMKYKDKNCIHYEYAVTAETYDRKKYVFDPIIEDCFDLSLCSLNQNFGPIINEPSPKEVSNCESVSISSNSTMLRVDLIATRFIAKGDEIFMLYNRSSEYEIGTITPLPLELKFKKNNSKINLLCFDMNWYDNLDWFRLIYWYNEKNFSIYTFGSNCNCPTEFELFHLKTETELKQKISNKENIIFIDYAHNNFFNVDFNLLLSEFFLLNLQYIILPFPHHDPLNYVYEKLLLDNKNYKCTIEFFENTKDFLFDCYGARKLDNTYPLIKITQKKKQLFTRFRDVWNEERIINDNSISDIKTLQWLKDYGTNINNKLISLNLSNKPLTLSYIRINSFGMK